MDDVLVGSLMSTPVRTVTPDVTVRAAAQEMLDHDISSVVVVDEDNQPVGILTSTDYVRIAADGASVTDTPVSSYLTAELVTTTAGERVRTVAETMMAAGVHHVPVVDEAEGAIGMITTKDFAAYLSAERAPSPPGGPDR
ncbi:MAG: CBS domain-containing protein [Halorientalis sp.]